MVLIATATALAGAAPAAASAAPCTDSWNGAAADGLWSDGGNWSTGSAPTGADVACIGQGASVELDPGTTNFTIAGLELDGATLTAGGPQSLTVSGELDLQNATPGSPGVPDVVGSGLSLTSQGATTVDPDLDVCLAAGDALENSGTLTLGDGADLGGGNRTDCTGASGGGVTNTGTIASQATDSPATIDNLTSATGSTLDGPGTLDVGSTLSLPAGASGQVDLADQLTLDDDAPTTVGANVQVCEDPSATVIIGSPATVTLGEYADLGAGDTVACEGGHGGGQVTDQGTITVPNSATIGAADFDNEGAVDLTGTSGTLLIAAASSTNGDGDTGTYAIAQGTTLDLGNSRVIDFGGTSGTTFSGGGTLDVSSGTTDFETGADLGTLSHFEVDSGASAEVDDTLEAPAGGTVTLQGDLDGYGFVTIPAGTSTTLSQPTPGQPTAQLGQGIDVVNDGSMTIAGSTKACIDEDATLENAGTLFLGSSANLGQSPANPSCDPSGTLLNDQGATITSTGATVIGTSLFDNSGAVTVGTGSTLAVDANSQTTDTGSYAVTPSNATLSIQAGASRVLEGTISGAGKLSVTGSNTSLEVMPDASGSIGTLNVGGGATLQFDAGNATPRSGSPADLTVAGAATFAPNSTVSFNGDALTAPNATETLALLSFASHNGTPSFPQDDNGWSASLGTVGAGSGLVATVTPVPPQDQTPPTIAGSAVAGGALSVTQGSWTGSPTHVGDEWEDCDPYGDPCTVVATGPTFSPTEGDVGDQIEVVETATNAGGSTSVDSAPTTAVVTLAPVNLNPPEVNGDEGTVGEVLTEAPGQWQNNPSIAVQWEDCDITGTVCTPIPGAVGGSYKTTEKDVNDSIVVVETASNAYGSAQAESDPTEPLMDLGAGDPTDPTDPSGGGNGTGGRSSGTATVSIPAHTVSGTDLSIALRCPKQSSCPVTLTLTASEPTSPSHAHASAHRSHSRPVLVGSESVRIAAGDRRTVIVSLNRTGTKLLASAHTLRTVLVASSIHSTLERTSVTFTAVAHRSSKPSKTTRSGSTHRTSHKHRPSTHHATRHTPSTSTRHTHH